MLTKRWVLLMPLLLTTLAQAENAAPAAATAGATAEREETTANRRNCVRETGSLIHNGKDCLNVNGTSYSRGDLDNTGAVTPGYGLQQLDPSVTIHR